MEYFLSGIRQFQERVYPAKRELFEQLSTGQRPRALMVTCVDSRICPSLITQCEPGDLFVLRNAGNLVHPYGTDGAAEEAAVELAVEQLGVCDIIVCGHSDCSAAKAIMTPKSCRNSPALKAWLFHSWAVRQIVREKFGTLEKNELLRATTETNVLVQLENLRTHPVVAAALASRGLRLHGWVYNIGSGEILVYQPREHCFIPVRQGFDLSHIPE
jgi:carbonic anhydrase